LWWAYDLDVLKSPKIHMPRHIEGPQGYTGGPNGPAAVLQDTRGGATWKYAVSQNPAALDQIFCRTPYRLSESACSKAQVLNPDARGVSALVLVQRQSVNPSTPADQSFYPWCASRQSTRQKSRPTTSNREAAAGRD
jgi:hypothetical protein